MNWQAAVNGVAVVGIVALGLAGKFGPPGIGDQIALGAIQILGGFIGGVGAARLASRQADRRWRLNLTPSRHTPNSA